MPTEPELPQVKGTWCSRISSRVHSAFRSQMCRMLKAGVGVAALGAAASWAYLRHIMLPVGPDRTEFAQEVFAHRGCRFVKGIPENTVPAFQYAAVNCASGLECDVRLCKSGELVVFHDPVLGKHVEAESEVQRKRVSTMTLEDLQTLRLSEDTEQKNVRICTLEDVIAVAREHDVHGTGPVFALYSVHHFA